MLPELLEVFLPGPTATTTTAAVSDSVISAGTEGVFAYAIVAGAVAETFVTRSTIHGVTSALDSETSSGPGSALVP